MLDHGFFVMIIQTILIILRILRLFLFMWCVEHRYLNFSHVFLGNRGLINEVVTYLFFLFILVSNFWLGRYIWYQCRDFNDCMGLLGVSLARDVYICVVCFVMKLKYKWFDLPVNMWRIQAMANRRRTGDAGADEIAQAIHMMVDAMQPVAAQPRAMVPPTRAVTMEDVLKHKPSKFNSKDTPDEVNAWLRECEKIFRVLACIEAQQLSFATFLLVGDAEYWWTGMQEQMQTCQEEVSWTSFRTRFLEKYFLDSAKHALEADFLTLQ